MAEGADAVSGLSRDGGAIIGNVYDKYGTNNPVSRALMCGFLGTVTHLYERVAPATVLEVRCGEGHLAHHLVRSAVRPKRFVSVRRRARRCCVRPRPTHRAASGFWLRRSVRGRELRAGRVLRGARASQRPAAPPRRDCACVRPCGPREHPARGTARSWRFAGHD